MNKLPPELLARILLCLPPLDRLTHSTTCRRWAEATTSSQLLDDIWLDIAKHEMRAATSVLVSSRRQYPKLRLFKVDLSELDSEFWGKIGAHLRVLELEKCTLSTHVFYGILQQCTKLESLKLVEDESQTSIVYSVLPEGACSERLRCSLTHLRHLHLQIKLTAKILDFLLGLMPNVISIFLAPCHGSPMEPDFFDRLSSILNKDRMIRTGADFSMIRIRSEDVIKFVGITSASLEELRMLDPLTENSRNAIVNCTRLRCLILHFVFTSFNASYLRRLVSNSPNLEVLGFYGNDSFRDEDMVCLLELKKLRRLNLGWCAGVTKRFLWCLGRISTLVKVDLRGLKVDSQVMRSLGRLENLRSLILDRVEIDPLCFGAICENLKRLTELDLGVVNKLTDDDGIKLCGFSELQSLRFVEGYRFSDKTFERGVGSRKMKSLDIWGCSLTDVGLMSIASHHNRLEKLALQLCKKVTNAGVVSLLKKSPRLKILHLVDCEIMRCKGDTAFTDFCPRLRQCEHFDTVYNR